MPQGPVTTMTGKRKQKQQRAGGGNRKNDGRSGRGSKRQRSSAVSSKAADLGVFSTRPVPASGSRDRFRSSGKDSAAAAGGMKNRFGVVEGSANERWCALASSRGNSASTTMRSTSAAEGTGGASSVLAVPVTPEDALVAGSNVSASTTSAAVPSLTGAVTTAVDAAPASVVGGSENGGHAPSHALQPTNMADSPCPKGPCQGPCPKDCECIKHSEPTVTTDAADVDDTAVASPGVSHHGVVPATASDGNGACACARTMLFEPSFAQRCVRARWGQPTPAVP